MMFVCFWVGVSYASLTYFGDLLRQNRNANYSGYFHGPVGCKFFWPAPYFYLPRDVRTCLSLSPGNEPTGLSRAVSVMNRRNSSQPDEIEVTRAWSEVVNEFIASFRFSRSPTIVSAANVITK